MTERGLAAVANPSALFLSDRAAPPGVSSAVTVTCEGTRPLLLEVQALCSPMGKVSVSMASAHAARLDRIARTTDGAGAVQQPKCGEHGGRSAGQLKRLVVEQRWQSAELYGKSDHLAHRGGCGGALSVLQLLLGVEALCSKRCNVRQ